MPGSHVSVVLAHGAWADGSSWAKVIGPLQAAGLTVVAAPLPLSSLADDIAAVECVVERVDGPVVHSPTRSRRTRRQISRPSWPPFSALSTRLASAYP